MKKTTPSDEEIATVATTLSKLQPGFLPLPIFLEVARLVTLPIVEIVPLRISGGKLQVLLIARDKDDPYYPDALHTPGTVIRATDEDGSYASAFTRILSDELGGVEIAGEPRYVESILHTEKRGQSSAVVFYVEVIGEPQEGTFYDVAQLPETIVDSQIDFIQAAAQKFSETR